MSSGVLGDEEFLALFHDFEHSALRLESRSHTDIDDERPEVEAFLSGSRPERYEWEPDDWTAMIGRHIAAGRSFRRTRVMNQPPTDYNRYMAYTARRNIGAGEDIRFLGRDRADALDLPDHDFWVFDSTLVCTLRFTADGRPLRHDAVTDPTFVAKHEEWAVRAFDNATPYDDYLAEDPTRAWPPTRLGATNSG